VPVAALRSEADVAALAERFHQAHRRRYGHMAASEAIEIVNFQVTAVGKIAKPQFHADTAATDAPPPQPQARRRAYFSATEAIQVPVYRRSALTAGAIVAGPAVIEEKTSTIVIYPGQRAAVDGYLNIEVAPASGA